MSSSGVSLGECEVDRFIEPFLEGLRLLISEVWIGVVSSGHDRIRSLLGTTFAGPASFGWARGWCVRNVPAMSSTASASFNS